MGLRISVLFLTKFASPSLGVLTEIIGKDGRREEEIGYQWGMKLTRLGDGDHLKARYLLKGIRWRRLTRKRICKQFSFATGDVIIPPFQDNLEIQTILYESSG